MVDRWAADRSPSPQTVEQVLAASAYPDDAALVGDHFAIVESCAVLEFLEDMLGSRVL
jgi:hypothetical protein